MKTLYYRGVFVLSQSDSTSKSYKTIAIIEDSKHYHEANIHLKGPDADHGIIGTFKIESAGIYGIKALYNHPSNNGRNAQVATVIDGEKKLWLNWYGNDLGTNVQKQCVILLSPGIHELRLFMDADNDGPSDIYYQKYEIIQMLALPGL